MWDVSEIVILDNRDRSRGDGGSGFGGSMEWT